MSNLIYRLYSGEYIPAEQFRPRIEAYQELQRRSCAEQGDFTSKLNAVNPDLTRQFVDIVDILTSKYPLESAEVFCQGFRMGAQLMLEVLGKD